ncbi:MAG: IS21 family transposase [Alphaproteobacteria bacterium]|nr:IS21 family transposase [Alphaproteobacteria bacterium]
MHTTILTLHKQGKSQRSISKITNIHRRTIFKVIKRYKEENLESPVPYNRSSKLDQWHKEIIELLSKNLSSIRVFEELKSQGYDGSYSLLNKYISKHKIQQNTCIRFHTKSGEEAQVDFGDIGKQYDSSGKLRKAYVFNMRLSYSRLDYYEVVFDQKINSWLQCHINAFNYFAGAPSVIKLDNLRSGVIDSNFYEPVFQIDYKRLAEHYDVLLSPCRPYSPQEKGKVESGIKYVKNNFFAGRTFDNYDALSLALEKWQKKANDRIHGTTRKKPRELFEAEERAVLKILPLEDFSDSNSYMRKVSKDCHITFENNYYSVPSKYVASNVRALVSNKLIKIYSDNSMIATHTRSKGKGEFNTILSHYDKYKRQCPGFPEYDNKYSSKMESIGKHASSILSLIKKEYKGDWHKPVRGIIKLCEIYDKELVDKACYRALCYGIISYSKIKAILENGCYDLPIADFGGSYANIA